MVTFRDRHGEPEVIEDDEPITYHGEELTEERAEQLAQETIDAIRRKNLIPGRKSLSGGGNHSPRVQFRVPDDLRDQLDAQADAEEVSVSKVVRQAVEEYLTNHRSIVIGAAHIRRIKTARQHGDTNELQEAVQAARNGGEPWAVIAAGLGLSNGAEAKKQFGDLVDH